MAMFEQAPEKPLLRVVLDVAARRVWRKPVPALAIAAVAWFATGPAEAQQAKRPAPAAQSAQAGGAVNRLIRRPIECVKRFKLPADVCARTMVAAWRYYQGNVPRYPTRAECARRHEVCTVYSAKRVPAPGNPRSTIMKLEFAPPFAAIRLRGPHPDQGIEVLIDRRMRALDAHPATAAAEAAAEIEPDDKLRLQYLRSLTGEPQPPEETGPEGEVRVTDQPAARSGFGPVQSFPVSRSRIESMRSQKRRLRLQ